MTQLLTMPPPPEAIAAMASIAGVAMVPTILATQRGPDGGLGPEGAGAVSILQATFADAGRASAFWRAASGLMADLAEAPGFIRRYSFADGPSITMIALWRTAADAHAFASRPEHRAAARELYRERWQYSHFAAVWELAEPRPRVVFCEQCDGITPLPASACAGCATPLVDVYAGG